MGGHQTKINLDHVMERKFEKIIGKRTIIDFKTDDGYYNLDVKSLDGRSNLTEINKGKYESSSDEKTIEWEFKTNMIDYEVVEDHGNIESNEGIGTILLEDHMAYIKLYWRDGKIKQVFQNFERHELSFLRKIISQDLGIGYHLLWVCGDEVFDLLDNNKKRKFHIRIENKQDNTSSHKINKKSKIKKKHKIVIDEK